ITIREGLDDEAMLRSLQSARVSLILSMNEGSCVAVAEALIADVPVGLIRDARIGSRCFINQPTGRFLNAGTLDSDLKAFVSASNSFSPRKWMLEHGHSYRESSAKLNAALKAAAVEQGLPWTTDIVPMQWRPNPEYLSLGDAALFREQYPRFEEKYGIAL